jgi:hypothetical protein
MIRCFCLFDITVGSDNPDSRNQKRNWHTMLQALSLRTGLIIHNAPKCIWRDVKNLGFGGEYTGSHNVWIFDLDVEDISAVSLDDDDLFWLTEDTNFIPMISGLSETAKFKINVLRQDGSGKNISFLYPFQPE